MQESSFRVTQKLVKSSAKSQSLRYKHGATDDDSIQSGRFSPTDAIPGTQEKLRVLVERIESGLPLWHPADRSTDALPPFVEENASHGGTSHSSDASNLDELFGLCGESDEQFN